MSSNVTKIAAGAAAVIAIGIGSAAVGSASSNDQTRTGNLAAAGPGGGQAPPGMSAQGGGAPRGVGTTVTGATADKVEAAALAKYPGTI